MFFVVLIMQVHDLICVLRTGAFSIKCLSFSCTVFRLSKIMMLFSWYERQIFWITYYVMNISHIIYYVEALKSQKSCIWIGKSIETESNLGVTRGCWGERGMGSDFLLVQAFFWGWWKCSEVRPWWWLHNLVTILTTIKLYTFKGWIWWYVSYISICQLCNYYLTVCLLVLIW